MSAASAKPKILCVDDEPEVLEGLRLHLRKHYRVVPAASGAEGLERIRDQGPFAVVISDMRMPGMDGAEFLAQVRGTTPDTTRVLLTGQADVESTVKAVNDGAIFRFLTKPCPPNVLLATVEDAVEQWRLINAERELLEGTLRGAVRVLTEVLALVNPPAFNCASRLEKIVSQVIGRLGLPHKWKYEVAAMLSQMGCISLPVEIMDKLAVGEALDTEEDRAYRGHPDVAFQLVAAVPRLETVAEMIRTQLEPVELSEFPANPEEWDPAVLGSWVLHGALLFDRSVARGLCPAAAAERLREGKTDLPAFLFEALASVEVAEEEFVKASVRAGQLVSGMVLDADACRKDGYLVAAKGTKLSPALVLRLRNFAQSAGLEEPLHVLVSRPLSAAGSGGNP